MGLDVSVEQSGGGTTARNCGAAAGSSAGSIELRRSSGKARHSTECESAARRRLVQRHVWELPSGAWDHGGELRHLATWICEDAAVQWLRGTRAGSGARRERRAMRDGGLEPWCVAPPSSGARKHNAE